jgi:hypothetical protein
LKGCHRNFIAPGQVYLLNAHIVSFLIHATWEN